MAITPRTRALRESAFALTAEEIDIAHIVDEMYNSNMAREGGASSAHSRPFDLVLPADARTVVFAAEREYLRRWPTSTHFAKRRGMPWYDEWHLDRAPAPAGSGTNVVARTWLFSCKFCHEELAQLGVGRGENRIPKALADRMGEHGLLCATALVLWVALQTAKPSHPMPECPARSKPRTRRR